MLVGAVGIVYIIRVGICRCLLLLVFFNTLICMVLSLGMFSLFSSANIIPVPPTTSAASILHAASFSFSFRARPRCFHIRPVVPYCFSLI